MTGTTKYRQDIQALRGLAVLAAVVFHADESLFPFGYLGVDVFFVISGFVVTPLIFRVFGELPGGESRSSNIRHFYRRRFYRLAPALAVTLMVSTVAIFLFAPISIHERFARQGVATLLLVGNLGAYRYSGNYFSPEPNPLVHTWSLSVEEQIYLFLPLLFLLILFKRKRPERVTFFVLVLITFLSFLSFLLPELFQPIYSKVGMQASQFSFYSPTDRIWQFTLGGIAYVLFQKVPPKLRQISGYQNCFLALLIIFILFNHLSMGLKISSFLASITAFLVIFYKSLDVLPKKFIVLLEWLGDRSYSIYLIHMPLIYLARYSPLTDIGNGQNRIIQSVIAVSVSFALGSLIYEKIENRFRENGKLAITRPWRLAKSLALFLILPLLLLVAMDRGSKHQYWGLERETGVHSIFAGSLDVNCKRDSQTGPPCSYLISGATKTVLLIGDSHAVQISQAVVDSARNQNWNAVVWAHSSCHVQFARSKDWQATDSCIAINLQMKQWVAKNRPTAIIISQFVYRDSAQADLRTALIELKTLVPNILMVENNPIFPDARDFGQRRPIVMSRYNPPKVFNKFQMETKDQPASDKLAAWAREHGIHTLNLNSLFCMHNTCHRYSNGEWLYTDDDHLSVFGARLAIPKLEIYLNSM
jgi:peptidoglycan/LPS O-acetylase OafA/YrhL